MSKIKSFFKINDSYKSAILSLTVSMVVGLMAYNLYIIYGYTNPDGIVEGLTSYINASWHIAGCGRYGLAILLSMVANVHMSFVTVLGFIFFSWLSGFVICKLWDINSTLSVTAITTVMIVSKSTIDHITTNTVALPYAISCSLATLFVYLIFNNQDKFSRILSVVFLAASLSIYQAYIGFAACLCLMTIIVYLLRDKVVLKISLQAIAFAVVACILYFVGLKLVLIITGLTTSSRMADLSIHSTLQNLVPQIKNIYHSYFNYFFDTKMHKEIIYGLIGLSLLLLSLFFVSRTKGVNKIVLIVSILLIPVASNIETVLTPNVPIASNMQYQCILIVPFAICLASLLEDKQILKIIICTLAFLLSWAYIVCANATFRCYQLSYNSINYQMSEILSDVIRYEDYELNESKLLFVGYPNDQSLRDNIKTYKYAYDFDEISSVVFWEGEKNGYTYNRRNYLLNYFGIDAKDITFDEYLKVINSDEFKEMAIWPKQGSVKIIGDIVVVKLTNDPFTGE